MGRPIKASAALVLVYSLAQTHPLVISSRPFAAVASDSSLLLDNFGGEISDLGLSSPPPRLLSLLADLLLLGFRLIVSQSLGLLSFWKKNVILLQGVSSLDEDVLLGHFTVLVDSMSSLSAFVFDIAGGFNLLLSGVKAGSGLTSLSLLHLVHLLMGKSFIYVRQGGPNGVLVRVSTRSESRWLEVSGRSEQFCEICSRYPVFWPLIQQDWLSKRALVAHLWFFHHAVDLQGYFFGYLRPVVVEIE